MSMLKEFKDFALKGNVVDLAVAVVIGAAFGKIVKAVVDDVIMPVATPFLPSGNWREYTVTGLHIKVGDLAGNVIDFVIVAAVLFLVVVKLMGRFKQPAPVVAPTTKQCKECLETIPIEARRCRACTSILA